MTPELYALSNQLTASLKKHHVVLFISCLGIMLSVAIYLMYQTTQSTFVLPNATSSSITDFDQKTIQKIKDLHDSSTSPTVMLPASRPNPFSE
jgi:hypothetical protein